MKSNKMPFGKYSGETIEFVVKADLSYAKWLLTRKWFNGWFPVHYEEMNFLVPNEHDHHQVFREDEIVE